VTRGEEWRQQYQQGYAQAVSEEQDLKLYPDRYLFDVASWLDEQAGGGGFVSGYAAALRVIAAEVHDERKARLQVVA